MRRSWRRIMSWVLPVVVAIELALIVGEPFRDAAFAG
jgi:hypothetical protein